MINFDEVIGENIQTHIYIGREFLTILGRN